MSVEIFVSKNSPRTWKNINHILNCYQQKKTSVFKVSQSNSKAQKRDYQFTACQSSTGRLNPIVYCR